MNENVPPPNTTNGRPNSTCDRPNPNLLRPNSTCGRPNSNILRPRVIKNFAREDHRSGNHIIQNGISDHYP